MTVRPFMFTPCKTHWRTDRDNLACQFVLNPARTIWLDRKAFADVREYPDWHYYLCRRCVRKFDYTVMMELFQKRWAA